MTKSSKLRTLERGMSGRGVMAIQHALNIRTNGLCLPENGHFGPLTEAAVREYKEKNGLGNNGRVGDDTRRWLFPIGVRTTTFVCTTGSDSWKLAANRAFKLSLPQFHYHIVDPLKLWLPIPFPIMPDLGLPDPPKLPPGRPGGPPDPFRFPPLRTPVRPRTRIGGFEYDHGELQPNFAYTYTFDDKRHESVMTLTIAEIYGRGPNDGPHQELSFNLALGVPLGYPVIQGPVTVNPYVQFTDVDRFGHLGLFHYWGPYAQAGVLQCRRVPHQS
jgi:hypothetical protein